MRDKLGEGVSLVARLAPLHRLKGHLRPSLHPHRLPLVPRRVLLRVLEVPKQASWECWDVSEEVRGVQEGFCCCGGCCGEEEEAHRCGEERKQRR